MAFWIMYHWFHVQPWNTHPNTWWELQAQAFKHWPKWEYIHDWPWLKDKWVALWIRLYDAQSTPS